MGSRSHSLMADSSNYNLLTGLPIELQVEVMRNLPDFNSVNQLMLADSYFVQVVHRYQYAICEPVMKNQLGALWKQARQLLVIQSKSNCAASKLSVQPVGMGILYGGDKVGIAEIFQIMSNMREIERIRNNFAAVSRSYSTQFSTDYIPAIGLANEGLTPDYIFRIDRGYYSVWAILLACGPGLKKLFEKRRVMARTKAESEKDLSLEEELGIYLSRHPDLGGYLQYKGREIELEELIWLFGASWLFRLLPSLGPEIIGRPYEKWCRANEDGLKAEARIQIQLHELKVNPIDNEDANLDYLKSLFMFGP